jgi:hypothetical protein
MASLFLKDYLGARSQASLATLRITPKKTAARSQLARLGSRAKAMGQDTLRPKTIPRDRGTKEATASLTAMPNQFLALAKWRGPLEPAASTRQRTSRD